MVGVTIDSLVLCKSSFRAGKMAADAFYRHCSYFRFGILSKAQQKLVIVLCITKQKLVFSIVVLA